MPDAAAAGDIVAEPQSDRRGLWLVDELNLLVAYETPQPTSRVRDWWTVATGLHPERVIEEPLTGAMQLEGQLGESSLNGNLIARTELSRLTVAWQYGSRPSPELLPAFDDVRQPFVEFAAQWLGFKTVPPIQRLGLGGVLVSLYSEIEDCRGALNKLLPAVDMEVAALRDFEYQGNRRCTARAVEGLELNRVAKWRVLSPPFTIQLRLDINTAPDHVGALSRLPDLFKELVDLADRFAEEGDRP